ncbi:carboxyl transferase domain-containing protein, partial [Kitasatospora sp. NPDC002543]
MVISTAGTPTGVRLGAATGAATGVTNGTAVAPGAAPSAAAAPAPRLGSSVDPGSEAYRANTEAHRALVSELRAKLDAAALGGGAKARARHTARGKLLPRDRVDTLLDPASPFLELAPLAADGMYDGAAPAAGVIAGIGRVAGREVVVVANDATVKGGTYYPMTVKKHLRAQEVAPAGAGLGVRALPGVRLGGGDRHRAGGRGGVGG